MAVGPFLSCDTGYSSLLGNLNFASTNIAVCLMKSDGGASLNRAGTAYSAIKGTNITKILNIDSPAVGVNSEKIRFTHAKALFEAEGNLQGRYVVYVLGNWEALDDGDLVLGYVDLTSGGDAESVGAEFSFTPHGDNGLFEIARSAGVE